MSQSFKGLTITIGADTKQFNKEMKAVDRSINQTNRQVNELQKGLELEFNSQRFAEAQRLAQEAIQGTETKAQALREQLKFLDETGSDKSSSNYQKLQTELIKTENQAVLLKKRLEEINQLKLENLAKQFEAVGGGITKAGQALTPFSAAAGGVLAGLGAIGKSTIKAADDLKTFADRVNMSAEELQRWQYIAMQTDVTNADLQMGLTKTQSAFGSLAKGDINKAGQALLDLGFSAEEASKGMGANFNTLVATLASIEDPIIQAAYANELFGERMGSKLIPMLKSGGEGLAALSAEFEQFDTLTNDQIDSLSKFDNVLNKIKFSFKTIKDQIGVALLPVMQIMADFITNKIIPAVEKLTGWFTSLSEGQMKTILGTLAIVAAMAPALLIIGKLTTGIGGLIRSIGGISKALSFLSAHPIIAVIGVLIGLMAYLYTTNEEFRNSINNLVSTLASSLAPILDTLMGLFNSVLSAVMPLFNVLAGLLVPIINAFTTALKPLIDNLGLVLIPIFQFMIPILNKMIGFITILANTVSSFLVPVFEKLGEILGSIFSALPKAIEGVLKFIEKTVNSVIDFINKLIRNINKLGDVLGFTINELDRISMNTNLGKIEAPNFGKSSDVTATTPSQAISSTPNTFVPNMITNNDYSKRDVVINVTVENYAQEVDVDDMVKQINTKLAAQF